MTTQDSPPLGTNKLYSEAVNKTYKFSLKPRKMALEVGTAERPEIISQHPEIGVLIEAKEHALKELGGVVSNADPTDADTDKGRVRRKYFLQKYVRHMDRLIQIELINCRGSAANACFAIDYRNPWGSCCYHPRRPH